jgi:hypothetical protein
VEAVELNLLLAVDLSSSIVSGKDASGVPKIGLDSDGLER